MPQNRISCNIKRQRREKKSLYPGRFFNLLRSRTLRGLGRKNGVEKAEKYFLVTPSGILIHLCNRGNFAFPLHIAMRREREIEIEIKGVRERERKERERERDIILYSRQNSVYTYLLVLLSFLFLLLLLLSSRYYVYYS